MTELQKQVRRARRRLFFQSFLTACIWALAIGFVIAALAIGARKIWVVGIAEQTWLIGWLAGSAVFAIVSAWLFTWFRRASLDEAAIELDRRFGLKERVSSSLTMSSEEADTEFGKALINDATRKVERLDVRDEFNVKANRWAFVPVVTGLLAAALVFLPDAIPGEQKQEAEALTKEVARVRNSTTKLRKKIAQKSQELEKKNLKEAGKLAQKLEQGLQKLEKSNSNKKKTMVEMNNLANEIKKRRESLKGNDDLKKRLQQLKGMKIKDGPADKLAKAMQQGDFKEALKQVEELVQQLKDGKLNEEDKKKLVERMNQMKEKMKEMADQHDKAKKELEEKIEKAKQQGNEAEAKKMQQKLNQMQAQDEAMQNMKNMAQKMEQVAKNMQQGNQQEAMQDLEQMAQDLESMQQESEELQELDEMMDQLASAKDSMNCEQCDGGG